MLDAISQALGKPERFRTPPADCARDPIARALAWGGEFLKTFGKPERLLTCECERSESTTLAQAFQMINGDAVRRKLEAADNRIGRLLDPRRQRRRDPRRADPRRPLPRADGRGARPIARPCRARRKDRRKGLGRRRLGDLNSKEFLLRH